MPRRQRVLIIGSSSSTGTELIHALAEEKASRRPIIIAFCKQTSSLDQATKERCNRVIEGDYMQVDDIACAMKQSKADTVIFVPADASPCVSFSSGSQTALETVLERPEFSTVRLFSLSKGESTATTEPKKQPQHTEQQPTTLSPKGYKRKGNPHALKDALEGLSEFLQFVTCSNFNKSPLDRSDKSTRSTFTKPWKKQRNNTSPLVTKSLLDMVDDAQRDAPPTSQTFDSDVCASPSTPVRLKVNKERFVEFVVGAVLERGSSSSISSHGPARGILVTAE